MLSFEVKLKASQEVVDTKNAEIKELNDQIIKEKKENKGLILKHQVEINKFKQEIEASYTKTKADIYK